MDNKVRDKRHNPYYLVGISHQSKLLAGSIFTVHLSKNQYRYNRL